MPTVIPNCAEVTCLGTIYGQPWANVFHIDKGGSTILDNTSAGIIATGFNAAYSTELTGPLVNDWALNQIRVLDLQNATAPSFSFDVTTVGTASSDGMPPDIAGIVSWVTGLRGPRYRGRTYLCGFSEGGSDTNGRPDSATRGAMDDWAASLMSSFDMVIAHKDLGTFTAVTGRLVRDVWRRQRRRTYTS